MAKQNLLKIFGLVLLNGCLSNFLAWAAIPLPGQSVPKTSTPVQASWQLAQKARQVLFVEVPAISPTLLKQKKKEATNYSNTLRAYTVPGIGTAEQIVIEDLKTNRIFILEGLPPSPREFSQLIWVNENILSVERWSNPHYGWRYQIDVQKQQLITEDNIAS
jgi:hypothetical protein